MQILSCALLLTLIPLAAPAQTASSADAWTRVQQLKPGSGLTIRTTANSKTKCSFRSATADALTCTRGADLVFQRTDVRSISVSHRGRSTVIGLAVGAGIGGVAGAAAGQSGQIIGRGGLAAIFAVPLGFIGALVGATTDFAHSTVYKAP